MRQQPGSFPSPRTGAWFPAPTFSPKSGRAAKVGEQLERGARLYIKLHQKELGEDRIKLVVRDSEGAGGATAKAAARELITREGVEILGGVFYSPNAISIAPLATAFEVPFVVMQ